MDRNIYDWLKKYTASKLAAGGALRRRVWVLLSVLVIFGAADGLGQTTHTWTGGGGKGNQKWSKKDNWSDEGAPANKSTNSFVFSGSAGEFAPDNDRSHLSAASIVFAAKAATNAQSYDLVGNGLGLLGGVTNLSARGHTLSLDLILDAPKVEISTMEGNLTLAGAVSGEGSLVKAGAATLVLSGSNRFGGSLVVDCGVLDLASRSGAAAGSVSSVSVSQGATLLLSRDNQVNDAAAVTLSGGTIWRSGGVGEVFGNLHVTAPSLVDFGTGAPGTLSFGTYTPDVLLSVGNFVPGNILTFQQDLSGSINNQSLFLFDHGFTAAWGGSTFVITAIPEPSAFIAAGVLIVIMSWPSRRLMVRDFKRIVGLRTTGSRRSQARYRGHSCPTAGGDKGSNGPPRHPAEVAPR